MSQARLYIDSLEGGVSGSVHDRLQFIRFTLSQFINYLYYVPQSKSPIGIVPRVVSLLIERAVVHVREDIRIWEITREVSMKFSLS